MNHRDGVQWFGPEPWGPVCEFSDRQPTPVGRACMWCGESFLEGDSGMLELHMNVGTCVREPWHRECFLRTMSGSIQHQRGLCACHGGTVAEVHALDVAAQRAVTMTKREEAIEAVRIWTENAKVPL